MHDTNPKISLQDHTINVQKEGECSDSYNVENERDLESKIASFIGPSSFLMEHSLNINNVIIASG